MGPYSSYHLARELALMCAEGSGRPRYLTRFWGSWWIFQRPYPIFHVELIEPSRRAA